MNSGPILPVMLAVWLAILACCCVSTGATPAATAVLPGEASAPASPATSIPAPNTPISMPTSLPAGSSTPTTPPMVNNCLPEVTANALVDVRAGPGTVYPIVGEIPQNGRARVTGKSADELWWVIDFPAAPGGRGWVLASAVTPACIPAVLEVVGAPPLPPPGGTCKDGYVFRLANPDDKVCVPPASQAQAAADNAAADSRRIINVYGVDACIEGYVWRGVVPDDHVCVTGAARDQTAADNAVKWERYDKSALFPYTCIMGYVWRMANPVDKVCVTEIVRAQTEADNAAADSRRAVKVYGPDACVAGYVWRQAFPDDRVCVTGDVRAQAEADNAAAPSHTWP